MLLVGTSQGLQDVDTGQRFVTGRAVTALAAGAASTWYALIERRFVVFLDEDLGEVSVGELPRSDGQSLVVLRDGTVAVGRTDARLTTFGRHGEVGHVQAFELVPGRDGWQNPANRTPDTRTMAAGSERWWVNVHVGGVWWSDDGGESWRCAVEPDADVHEVRVGTDGRVAVAAAVGFGWSENDGESWSWATEGLHGQYLRAAALDGDIAFVSASDGPITRNGAVYRAHLGESFARCAGGLPARFDDNIDSGHLDAAGGRAAVGFEDHVYLSEDQGRTWGLACLVPGAVTAVRFSST